MLRPLVRTPIGFVGGVAVLLLQLAYEAILLAPTSSSSSSVSLPHSSRAWPLSSFHLPSMMFQSICVSLLKVNRVHVRRRPSRGPSLDGVLGGAPVFIERLQPAAVAAEQAFRVRTLEPALAGRSAAPAVL